MERVRHKQFSLSALYLSSAAAMRTNLAQNSPDDDHQEDGTQNNFFGDAQPLDFVQIATWNDYDEGTEIETGIDNCFTFSTTVLLNPNVISWKFETNLGTYATMDTI